MEELIINLHMHTTYSDGTGSHEKIARAALQAGLDVVIITDHNVLVNGFEGYYQEGKQRVLLFVGEEVHDTARLPQKSHLLIFGSETELSQYSSDPQWLIGQSEKAGAITFIAHPYDPELKLFGEDDITWDDWQVQGYTGIEIWNGLSEFKVVVHNRAQAMFYALFPQYLAQGPQPQTLQKWDELLTQGRKVVAIGGSDAHELKVKMGPFRRVLYPYQFHFQCINTHVLIPEPLRNDPVYDRQLILDAIRQGHCFVAYDLPHPTRGFRFTAQGKDQIAWMGDEILLNHGVTFQIRLPLRTDCRLIRNGIVIKKWQDSEICTYIANQSGAYRVECTLPFLGRQRGWIFSNPIYVRDVLR